MKKTKTVRSRLFRWRRLFGSQLTCQIANQVLLALIETLVKILEWTTVYLTVAMVEVLQAQNHIQPGRMRSSREKLT
jgi:hypothetical protein